jgi:hypothetical protein
MLEAGTALRTWALESEPEPGQAIAARQLPDHRSEYLRYEGPISGGRGTVSRWDWGECLGRIDSGTQVEVVLRGRRLCGSMRLTRLPSDDQRWVVSFDSESVSEGR